MTAAPEPLPEWATVRATFQRLWGYPDFQAPQGDIVRCLLTQRDALVILPTGAGKSVCFQLPAILQSGLTLVVSPLVALMENQVQELRQRQLSAACFHSELMPQERRHILRAVAEQKLRLLYLSPESLLSSVIWQQLCQPHIQLNGLILDEAHCLTQWGDSFRPTYRRLGAVRPALLQSRPPDTRIAIAAFTATADSTTQQTIRQVLGLDHPAEFRRSPYRSNLHLSVRTVWTPRQRRQVLLQFLQKHQGQSGLVYVRSRRDTETLASWLNQQQCQTLPYHAGLSARERRTVEAAWLGSQVPIVICTSAFGMGVNKPDCRFVVHFQPPLLLSEYIQEVGRAGRDGATASALLLMSEPTGWLDPADQQRYQFFLAKLRQQQQITHNLGRQLPPQGDITEIVRQFPDAPMALAYLHSAGCLQWLDPFHYTLRLVASNQLTAQDTNTQAVQQMKRYLTTRQCRWQFLLQAFGFGREGQGMQCGHCDACRRS